MPGRISRLRALASSGLLESGPPWGPNVMEAALPPAARRTEDGPFADFGPDRSRVWAGDGAAAAIPMTASRQGMIA